MSMKYQSAKSFNGESCAKKSWRLAKAYGSMKRQKLAFMKL